MLNPNLTLFQRKKIKINIKNIDSSQFIREIRLIRKNILYSKLPKDFCIYEEDLLKTTYHFGLFVENELVCILTMIKKKSIYHKNLPAYQIRGMATKFHFQNQKLGQKLILYSIFTILNKTSTSIIWCNARISILNFYLKNNFQAKGKMFYIKNIGLHRCMFFDSRLFLKQT